MNNKGYYAIIPASVRYDVRLTANAKLLYGEITALCNDKGYCWARNAYFADLYGKTETSVSQWISSLVECGYITRQLQYKEGTKQIQSRYLKLVDNPMQEILPTSPRKLNEGTQEILIPSPRKLNDPPQENLIVNNTINTTSNITDNRGETSSPAPEEEVGQEVIVIDDEKKEPVKRFVPPTLDEVIEYCNRKGSGIDPAVFWHHYEANGWRIGKNKMISWPKTIGSWSAREKAKKTVLKERKTDSIRSQSLHDQLTDTSWVN
jgi:DNA-binding transcriptional ArsR family regulator